MLSYEDKRDNLVAQFRGSGSDVRLGKDTSNLFRDRSKPDNRALDVRSFNHVLEVDTDNDVIEVEGMTTYGDLVEATLPDMRIPCVVPQLKSITIGGAISGVGIESSSFKYGLVHETVRQMEVLTGSGEVVSCTPDNEHRDLFYGLPNSYGTLGYVLKLKTRAIAIKPFVRLEHTRHSDTESYFARINSLCAEQIDFLDGVMFEPGEYYTTVGTLADDAPYHSDYTFESIYYKSIKTKEVDYLSTRDYLWRWDTDWFWCSKNVGAQNRLLRPLFGRGRLNSSFYTRIMRWNAKWRFTGYYNRARGIHTESVIQDVDIPIDRAAEFYEFFDNELGIRPVWICPIVRYDGSKEYPLFPMHKEGVYVNFGFWDVLTSKQDKPMGHYNKKVEAMVEQLGGIKSLYSDSFYSEEQFWQLYNREEYRTLKKRYDPNHRLKDLYDKCVLRN